LVEFSLRYVHGFNPSVAASTFYCAIVSNGSGQSESNGTQSLGFHSLLHHAEGYCFGPSLGELLIILLRTNIVGMSFNNQFDVWMLLEKVGQLAYFRLVFLADLHRVKGEFHLDSIGEILQ